MVDVPANTDRGFGHEPFLARFLAPHVAPDPVRVADDEIRDQLLEGGIVFRFMARNETIVPTIQQNRKISLRVDREALEHADLIDQPPFHYEQVFIVVAHGVGS